MGMAGEGVVDAGSVWVVKTHYPERYGYTKFTSNRCILITRNPLDCITSLFNMVATGSHTLSVCDEEYERFDTLWDAYI